MGGSSRRKIADSCSGVGRCPQDRAVFRDRTAGRSRIRARLLSGHHESSLREQFLDCDRDDHRSARAQRSIQRSWNCEQRELDAAFAENCGADARQSRHWPADETRARAAVGKQTLGSLVNGLRLLRRPAPTGRKRRAVGAANKGVVVEIPDYCLPSGGRVEQEVWLPIAVEISRANQLIAAGNIWSKPPAAHTGSR